LESGGKNHEDLHVIFKEPKSKPLTRSANSFIKFSLSKGKNKNEKL
jgi:hypothetical protein